MLADTSGTFTNLASQLSGDSADLEMNYTYDSSADVSIPKTGILIDHPITIDGKGHTIDAKNLTKIFNVTSSNVKIINVTFVNGFADNDAPSIDYSDCGGAIVVYSTNYGDDHALCNISLINCTFKDCSAKGYGGAVFTWANNVTVTGCTFERNNAPQRGGGFYTRGGSNITVSKSKFINNYQPNDGNVDLGGAGIYLYSENNVIEDSSFYGNYAHNGGGIYVQNKNTSITNCYFNGNNATHPITNYGGGGSYLYI